MTSPAALHERTLTALTLFAYHRPTAELDQINAGRREILERHAPLPSVTTALGTPWCTHCDSYNVMIIGWPCDDYLAAARGLDIPGLARPAIPERAT